MPNPQSLQLLVDVGTRCHRVAVGLTGGDPLEEFEISHTAEGVRVKWRRRVKRAGRWAARPATTVRRCGRS